MKQIRVKLLSDATFGRGDGVPGVVDDEIDHDPETGLPFIKGRTIKGLVVEECSNVLYSVSRLPAVHFLPNFDASAQRLFGSAGSSESDEGLLHFGEGRVADAIQQAVSRAVRVSSSVTSPLEILNGLTGVRRRSAINEETEAPADETLRSARVLMRGTEFFVPLVELGTLTMLDWQLLAACVAGLRRGGKNRNRGAGKLTCSLLDGMSDQTRSLTDGLMAQLQQSGVTT